MVTIGMSFTGGSGQIQVFDPATLFRVLWRTSARPNDGETKHFSRSSSATSSRWRNSSSSSSSEVPTRNRTFPLFPSTGMIRNQKSDELLAALREETEMERAKQLPSFYIRRGVLGLEKRSKKQQWILSTTNKHRMYLASKNQRPSFFGTP